MMMIKNYSDSGWKDRRWRGDIFIGWFHHNTICRSIRSARGVHFHAIQINSFPGPTQIHIIFSDKQNGIEGNTFIVFISISSESVDIIEINQMAMINGNHYWVILVL